MTAEADTLLSPIGQASGHYKRDKRFRFAALLMVVLAFAARACSAEEGAHAHDNEETIAVAEREQTTNAFCPVMAEMKVDPAVFADYKGKMVYFCCPTCRPTFLKNPQHYISRLPQFAGATGHAGHDHGDNGSGLTLAGLIKPLGITTLSLLVTTVSAALLRRKKPKLLLKWHKRLGITTLSFAALHAIIVLIAH